MIEDLPARETEAETPCVDQAAPHVLMTSLALVAVVSPHPRAEDSVPKFPRGNMQQHLRPQARLADFRGILQARAASEVPRGRCGAVRRVAILGA